MPIQKTLVPIPFAGGIDTKTDPKQVATGKLLALQNGVFQKTGAVSRRWGYTALGTAILGGGIISNCTALNAFNNELLLYDGTLAYSYVPADQAWAPRGRIVSCIETNRQIIAGPNQQLSPDFGILGGVELYVWEDSRGGIRYSTFDAATGTAILTDQPLYVGVPATAIRPKVMAFAGLFFVLFVDSSFGGIQYVTINPNAPTVVSTSATPLVLQLQAPFFFDAAVLSAATLGLVYYAIASPTTFAVRYAPLAASGGTLVAGTRADVAVITGAPPTGCLAITGDGTGNAWLLFPHSAGPSPTADAAVYSSTATVVLAATSVLEAVQAVRACTLVVLGTTATCFIESDWPLITYRSVISNTITIAGATGVPFAQTASAPYYANGVGLASKAFVAGGQVYVNAAFQTALQSTYFTLDSTGAVVAKTLAGLGGGWVVNSDSMLPECPAVATNVFKYPNLDKGIPNTEAGLVLSLLGVNATRLDFAHGNQALSAAMNGELYTVGGAMQRYDTARYVEQGFHYWPEPPPANFVVVGGGGAIAAGTYFYAVTYEWTDNTGAVELSAPSAAVQVVVGAGSNSVQVTIPTLTLTKKSNVRLTVYRTQASGQILYRVTSAAVPVFNNPTTNAVIFVDTLADASIAANGAMYTQPLVTGTNPVVPNSAPPSCSLVTTYADRLWVSGLDDPYTLWYSQTSIANSPMQFSALLTLRVDPDGGPITALARLDDKLVIFKQNAIFYLVGQGPTATGDANDFGSPVQIPSGEVGCVSPNSIVLTPIGLLFQSANGIYLLDRGLNVSYKGAPVESFTSPNEAALTITSATLIPNQWAVFTTASGTALVYDFYYDQWSTFTNHAAIDSALYFGGGNALVWAKSNGQVYQQTPTVFSDAGAPIPLSLTLAVNALEAIQGYQRVYHAMLLGTYKGTHTLQAACSFDFDDANPVAMALIPSDSTLGISTFGSASPFGIDTPFGGSPGQTVYQFRLDILRKCQRIVFQLSDIQSPPGNEGFSLSALTLVVGVKRGPFRVPAAKQFGVS